MNEKLKAVIPPSTEIICPVVYDEAGIQRNATKDDTSFGSPRRLRGVLDITLSKSSLLPSTCRETEILEAEVVIIFQIS